jgi:Holliday junction DNA helicase RuvB
LPDEFIDSSFADAPDPYENRLRPKSFADFIGQKGVVDNLQVYVSAAAGRGDILDHVLLTGPPGLGKTTLAHIIAAETGHPLIAQSGPALDKPAKLLSILTSLDQSFIIFIDEIHRMPNIVAEYLYTAMTDFKIELAVDQGFGGSRLPFELPHFTLVGATTSEGMLLSPFRDRFKIEEKLVFYPADELFTIVMRTARILGVEIVADAARIIAARSRGTPRIANKYVARIRDFAQEWNASGIDGEITEKALKRLGVDKLGLTRLDREILSVLARSGGKAVGLKTVAVSVSEEPRTIEEKHEPFLIQQGFIMKTPQGRVPTKKAFEHIEAVPPEGQGEMFN